jgi:hypothetical protein
MKYSFDIGTDFESVSEILNLVFYVSEFVVIWLIAGFYLIEEIPFENMVFLYLLLATLSLSQIAFAQKSMDKTTPGNAQAIFYDKDGDQIDIHEKEAKE